MSKVCILCNRLTIFYVWTSSRYFDVDKLASLSKEPMSPESIKSLKRDGEVVCFGCLEKYNLMDRRI